MGPSPWGGGPFAFGPAMRAGQPAKCGFSRAKFLIHSESMGFMFTSTA